MFSRMLSVTAVAAGLSFAAASANAQQMQMQGPKGTKKTISGTVVDVSCKFGHGLTGASHRECAQVCADRGIPLAILGKDGRLYVPASTGMPGDAQNSRLKEFAEEQVTVSGTVFPAGGANVIWIDSIERKS